MGNNIYTEIKYVILSFQRNPGWERRCVSGFVRYPMWADTKMYDRKEVGLRQVKEMKEINKEELGEIQKAKPPTVWVNDDVARVLLCLVAVIVMRWQNRKRKRMKGKDKNAPYLSPRAAFVQDKDAWLHTSSYLLLNIVNVEYCIARRPNTTKTMKDENGIAKIFQEYAPKKRIKYCSKHTYITETQGELYTDFQETVIFSLAWVMGVSIIVLLSDNGLEGSCTFLGPHLRNILCSA